MKITLILLALCGSALAYAFSGGYHPVPHITPHFSTPVHVSPHFSPAPHVTSTPHVTTAPHYTPTPHIESHPMINPAHPMYWVYHRNPTTGKMDSTPSEVGESESGERAARIIVFGSLIGIVGGGLLFWLVRRWA